MAAEAAPLVGRGDELAEIADTLADSTSAGVVLIGRSGVGKTELARHALRTAEAAGFVTVTVQGTRSASTVPLAALAPIVGDDLGAGRLAMLNSARARTDRLAGGGPLVVLVDDAHLLDDMSATLVHQLSGRDNVFVVATLRSGTEVPDPVTALWKDSGARRIDVGPLDLAGTEELVCSLLGGAVAIPALRRIVTRSQGLPMAVCELVDAARDSGVLTVEDGIWCLVGDLTISARLADLVELRLRGCSTEEREALATVALGEPLGLAVATEVVGSDILQALETRHLLLVHPDSDDVTLGHPLYGEVAVAGLGELHRRRVLTTLADAAAWGDRSDATDLRVAMWRYSAGADVGAEELLRGAVVAYRASSHLTTVQLAAAAWDRDRSSEAGHLLGLALGRLTRADEAETVLSEVTRLLEGSRIDNSRMRVLVTLARSENLFRGLNDAAGAIGCVEAGEAEVLDPVWRDELVGHRAMLILQTGAVTDALGLAEPLLTEATPDRPFVKAAYAAGLGLVYAGRTDDATLLAQRAMPVHERIWSHDLFQTEPGVHHVVAILALVESGQLTAAEQYAGIAVQAVAEAGEGYGLAYLSMLAGLASLRRGHLLTARRRCLDAVPLFRAAGYPSPLRWVLAGAAMADAMTGRVEEAVERMATVAELAGDTPVRLAEVQVHEAAAWTHVARADFTAARDRLHLGVDDALDRGELSSAAHLLHTLGRIGPAAEVVERLEDLSGSIDGDFHDLRVQHLRALVAGDGATLDKLARTFADRGADLLAAEAAAEAVRVHRRRGDQRAGARSVRSSEVHAARCEGAHTPSMTITGAVEPLTDREREIALLAAAGMSSKEIAERLVVSRRTVDNHLQRVFGKLGISGRGELPNALGRPRTTDRPR